MTKSIHKRYIILFSVLVMLAGTCAYRNYSLKRDKTETVFALETFYKAHSQYPKNLQELGRNYSDRFYYYSDSTRQSFRIGYSSGIMESTNNYYDSHTKQWVSEFVF